jgi:hypothetical protein
LEIPKLDLKAAGIDWLEDPVQAQQAEDWMWGNVLRVLTAHGIVLNARMSDMDPEEDEGSIKYIEKRIMRLEKQQSPLQTLLRPKH